MKLLDTYDTQLKFWDKTNFTVVDQLVILWGKSSDESGPLLHLFHPSSTGLEKFQELDALCKHEDVLLQSVRVKNTQMLAVSCVRCRMIRLYDMQTGEVTKAFHNQEYYTGSMSPGDGEVLYVVHHVKGHPVLELNTEQIPFTGPSRTIPSRIEGYFDMHYIPAPHKQIVISSTSLGLIRAVSMDGEKMWEVKGEIEGKKCDPHGLLFSPDHQVLLVADGTKSRVIVLNPQDGSVLQTIQLDQLGSIAYPHIHQQQLIVQHTVDNKVKVSYFSLNHPH